MMKWWKHNLSVTRLSAMGNMVITTLTLILKPSREQTKSAAIFMKMWSELFWKAKVVSFVGMRLFRQQDFSKRCRCHIMWTMDEKLKMCVLVQLMQLLTLLSKTRTVALWRICVHLQVEETFVTQEFNYRYIEILIYGCFFY